jgi:hypothetical protein
MRKRELDVGLAHLAAGALRQRVGEHLETLLYERGEQAVAVREVAVRGIVRDPRSARHFPQAERSKPLFFQDFPGLPEHGAAQVSVMIC